MNFQIPYYRSKCNENLSEGAFISLGNLGPRYRKVANINMTQLEAHFRFYGLLMKGKFHGLRTPNEGINQKKSENLGRCGRQNMLRAVPKYLGVGVDFRPCSEDNFLTGRP